jgi:hypothetical protein
MEGVLSDGSYDPDEVGADIIQQSPWFLANELTNEQIVPSGFDGLRVAEIIGARMGFFMKVMLHLVQKCRLHSLPSQ